MTPEEIQKGQFLREWTETALNVAFGHREELGAVNWGDLSVVRVLRWEDDSGDLGWMVEIEEADPSCGLGAWLTDRLYHEHGLATMEFRTEW